MGHVTFPIGNTLWSSVTSPGWVMMGLWSVFLVLSILFFKEPDRSLWYVNSPKEETVMAEPSSEYPSVDDPASRSELLDDCPDQKSLVVPEDVSELLHHADSGDSDLLGDVREEKKEQPLWKNAAVMNSLWLYFVLKLVLEMLLSSTPSVTKYYFDWESQKTGLFMMCMALLMFPANMVVARLSQRYEDRELIWWTLVLMMISVVGIMDLTRHYFVFQYMIFAVGIFISSNALEGPNMGLLSKTIPKSWARGTFNSGFLATEAGTLARSVGDVLISGVASTFGMSMLLNGLFAPMAALVAISLLLVRKFYSQLTEADEDDDTVSIASGSTIMDDSENRK